MMHDVDVVHNAPWSEVVLQQLAQGWQLKRARTLVVDIQSAIVTGERACGVEGVACALP